MPSTVFGTLRGGLNLLDPGMQGVDLLVKPGLRLDLASRPGRRGQPNLIDDSARGRGHHKHAVAEIHGFLDGVRHEQHGAAVGLP